MARVKMEDLTAVISRDFCVPQRVNLTVVRKLLAVTDCNFEVIDEDGNIMFKVKQKLFSLHDRRILLDAGGTPIATLRKKHLSARKRWQVFKGESSDSSQLLFTARKSSLVQLKTELDIFLSGNEDETSWDFKVVGGWLERSCIIYSKGWNHIAKVKSFTQIRVSLDLEFSSRFCFCSSADAQEAHTRERCVGEGYVQRDCLPES
ncbi:protein LURP-one-related 15-like isoform X1 [Salvia miltiorrhiza]|uniref:protein LURP-one-related 15-like isoform X1 n=1 Tax=Salvia miltiorrhiza TaxID=226208 RepID=UPI0025AD8351|nr:protein LURP-one-related 15-like isoform X1 [Salvia miltiorrhiza]